MIDQLNQLEKLIPERMAAGNVPGLSITLIDQARPCWSKAFGVKHAGLKYPATPGTLFEAASLSKPVFAYGVLKLCERGVLGLDVPLTEYVSEPYIPDEPRLNTITARMVLSHTTGLQNWLWVEGERPALQFTPGTQFSYSSLGYIYLQQAVERITGRPLAALMRDDVLDPLGMRRSSFVWRDDDEADAATGHNEMGEPVAKWKPEQALACASLHTTPLDYARFLITMMSASDDIAAQMLRHQFQVSDTIAWGLGWGIEHTHRGDAFWHWGDNGIFKSLTLATRAQQKGVVIMTNSANGLKLCVELVRTISAEEHPLFAWLEDFYR